MDVRRQLREWAGQDGAGLVFPAPDGGFLRRSNFARRQWRPAVEKVALDGLTFHVLRHAAATWAAQSGATIRELMEFLGHTSPRAALIYQHSAKDRARRIADGMDQQAAAARPKKRARKGHDAKRKRKPS